jgi:hypothetical protein
MPSLHRIDMRLQRRFNLGRGVAVDGIVEAFNVLNHANYGTFTLVETNANYKQPADNTNIAFQPRTLQLGFRMAF